MKKKFLSDLFQQYDTNVQQLLEEVLLLEQQNITHPLKPNSTAFRELREKIDASIERVVEKK